MFKDGVVYYFPFAFKIMIFMFLLALPWDKWLSFLPQKAKDFFVNYRNFLAPTADDEGYKWYFKTSRLILSIVIFLLPIAYDYFVPEVAGDIRWYMMQTTGLILATLFFFYIYEKGRKEKSLSLAFKQPFTVWMALITVLFGALTISWGMSFPNNWWFFKNLLGYALIFSFAMHLRNDQWYKNILWLLAASVSFNAILGIMQYFDVTDAQIVAAIPFAGWLAETFPSLQNWKIIGFFQQSAPPAGAFANKNLAASFMVMTIPLFMYLIFTAKSNLKAIFAGVAFTLASVFLLYTRSRGSWVSACAAIFFAVVWLALNKHTRSSLISCITLPKALTFLVAIVIILVSSSAETNLGKKDGRKFHSMNTTVSEQFASVKDIQKGELATRLAYNINGVDILMDHPLGVGLGGFHTVYPKYHKSSMVTPRTGYNLGARPRRMHNDMFQAFIELGIIGGLAHLLFFLSPLWMTWKIQKSTKSSNNVRLLSYFSLVGIGGMCVNSIGDFPLQMPTAPGVLWLLVGVVTGLYVIYAEKPTFIGFNVKTFLPRKESLMLLAALCFALTAFITYDNFLRREGTLYLKPALGMSRSGNNGDSTVYFINKSMETYPYNPRAREIWGVIHMSHKKGLMPGHNMNIGFKEREHTLTEAIKYDPYAQNNLINLAMANLSQTQKHMREKNLQQANVYIQRAHAYAKRAYEVSHYTANAPTALAICYLYTGQNQKAYDLLQIALERQPGYSAALDYLKKLEPLIKQGVVKPIS